MENKEVNKVEENNLQQTETGEQKIDFDKFDKGNEEKPELDEAAELKKEVERLKAEKEAAEERAKKFKNSFDKKASEVAALNRQLSDTKKEVEEPIEKLLEYEQQLAEYELKEKKTNLLYSLTETLGVEKDMSNQIVSAIYNEETNELSVGDLENALRELVNNVRETAYNNGYETRDTEFASGKPRSLGKQENLSLADQKKQEYLEKKNRHRR